MYMEMDPNRDPIQVKIFRIMVKSLQTWEDKICSSITNEEISTAFCSYYDVHELAPLGDARVNSEAG